MIKRLVKRAIFRCCYYSGIEYLVARLVPVNAAAMIMYHGVCDDSRLPADIDFHLTRAEFDSHMRMLRRRYPIVPLTELLDRLERGTPLAKAVVITFDDGYRNNATHAFPILSRHRIPSTIFLATSRIGAGRWLPLNELYALWHFGHVTTERMRELRAQIRREVASAAASILAAIPERLSDEERALAADSFAMLSWEQVRKLAQSGVEFGSHTHSHCNMAAESEVSQREELRLANDAIRDALGAAPAAFAYPFGHAENWTPQTRAHVIEAGHRCAILATGGLVSPEDDVYALPRAGCERETWYFACELALLFLKRALTH